MVVVVVVGRGRVVQWWWWWWWCRWWCSGGGGGSGGCGGGSGGGGSDVQGRGARVRHVHAYNGRWARHQRMLESKQERIKKGTERRGRDRPQQFSNRLGTMPAISRQYAKRDEMLPLASATSHGHSFVTREHSSSGAW